MTWLLYGANGYTGRLIAAAAKRQGLAPILAGRNQKAIAAMAGELSLPYRICSLSSPDLATQLHDVKAVLHCAGPFSATARPMVDACLQAGVHYCDITGEWSVFEDIYARHDEAVARGVALVPGVGFDVVPTDALAAHLVAALPDANELELFLLSRGGVSHGTLQTALENIGRGMARIDGKLCPAPGVGVDTVIAGRRRRAWRIPWGDIASAFRSTSVPNIHVYLVIHPQSERFLRASDRLPQRFIDSYLRPPLHTLAGWLLTGPSAASRKRSRTVVAGRVTSPAGAVRTASLTLPDGYDLTAATALAAVQHLSASHEIAPGAWTPTQLFGDSFLTDTLGLPAISVDELTDA